MRFSTKLFACVMIILTSFSIKIFAQCASGVNYYPSSDAFSGWASSNYPMIFDLDAATLTDASYPKTAAVDGEDENFDYNNSKQPKNPVGSGVIPVTLYDYDESGTQHDSGKKYYVKYYNCVFAPEHHTSAYVKLQKGKTEDVSGCGRNDTSGGCEKNDNSVFKRNVFSKQGFIELNRQASTEVEGSKHGYIQLDGLRGVEKIQWSFSSTAWKRGVSCEVRYGEDPDWYPLRTLPSAVKGYCTFGDQGYEFEESLNLIGEDEREMNVSIRFRIWDGDETTWEDELDYPANERNPGFYYLAVDPYSIQQVVRIHQIRVYSCFNGSELSTGIDNNDLSAFYIYKSDNSVYATMDSNIEIYTIDGQLAKQGLGKQIDVTNLSKGIYVVRATSLNGVVKNTKISL